MIASAIGSGFPPNSMATAFPSLQLGSRFTAQIQDQPTLNASIAVSTHDCSMRRDALAPSVGCDASYQDDITYPVHLLDGTEVQHCIMASFFRFNDILDHDRIKGALATLFQIGDWKKLGGRFRTKVRLIVL